MGCGCFCNLLVPFIRQGQSLHWILSKSRPLTNSADSTVGPPGYVPPVTLSASNWGRVLCKLPGKMLELAAWALASLCNFIQCWHCSMHRAGCFPSQHICTAATAGGLPPVLRLGLKSVYGVQHFSAPFRFANSLPSRHSMAGILAERPLCSPLWACPKTATLRSLLSPSASARSGCTWHFQLSLGLFFNDGI